MVADNQHTIAFRDRRLRPGECIIATSSGWIDDGGPSPTADPGMLILTSERLCHYRSGRLADQFTEYSLGSVIGYAVEATTGHRRLRLMMFGRNALIKSINADLRFQTLISELGKRCTGGVAA